MSTPFLGQVSPFAFNFAPKGWTMCNGQLLSIQQNAALFSLLGTTYGGDGVQTFALPDLRGAIAVQSGSGYPLGATGGEAIHTLLISETPAHTHTVGASTAAATELTAADNFPAVSTASAYSAASPNTTLSPGTSTAGSSQPHGNMAPYLVINYCIALQGIFPSQG